MYAQVKMFPFSIRFSAVPRTEVAYNISLLKRIPDLNRYGANIQMTI